MVQMMLHIPSLPAVAHYKKNDSVEPLYEDFLKCGHLSIQNTFVGTQFNI